MEESNQLAVITIPFPAQGHLLQLLQLSCLISSYNNIPVYYVASSIHIRQARARVNALNPQDLAKIKFQEIHIPPFASPPPDPNSSFPSHLQPVFLATLGMREPFAAYLREMAEIFKRVVVVHDSMMSVVVQDVGSIQNAESYALNCISAFSLAYFACKHMGKPFPGDEPVAGLLSFDASVPEDIVNLSRLQHEALKKRSGDLYNSCRLIEGQYLEILESQESGKDRKSWAIGPMLPINPSSSTHGFEQRVEGMGLVIKDWAPQPEILAHPSTGGFMSHCGWNSCIESITMGLPIAAWPMHSEQPLNAVLITGILKMGLLVRQWSPTKEVVKASSIENAVRRLMASEEGEEIRKRAEEVGNAVRKATQHGGASRIELDLFIAHITR